MEPRMCPINIWKGQLVHAVVLSVLLIISWHGWHIVGEPSPTLFWFAVSVPVIHQVIVWLAWHLELIYRVYLAG